MYLFKVAMQMFRTGSVLGQYAGVLYKDMWKGVECRGAKLVMSSIRLNNHTQRGYQEKKTK